MEKAFYELDVFTKWVIAFMTDDELAALESFLRKNPDAGEVVPGCGGIRKLRVADQRRGKGKRGGGRVLYLHVPEVNWIWFVAGYGKDVQEDLSPLQKRKYAQVAEDCRQIALRSIRRQG